MRRFGVPHLAHLPGPVRALDIEPAPIFFRTFQGTPVRHHRADAGGIFPTEKANGEAVTDEDEEGLARFASRAAPAVANARTHRAERRLVRCRQQVAVEVASARGRRARLALLP